MKSLDPNITVLSGSLLGSNIDRLNEIYQSGVKGNMNVLTIHPYIQLYLRNSCSDAEEFVLDECSPRNPSSKFWRFKYSID
jgi:hypothetical protein